MAQGDQNLWYRVISTSGTGQLAPLDARDDVHVAAADATTGSSCTYRHNCVDAMSEK